MSRRAFEQSQYSLNELNNPSDFNFAVGKAGQAVKNITKSVFLTWIYYLAKVVCPDKTFSNVTNSEKTSIKTSLGVYSTSETYTKTEVDNQITNVTDTYFTNAFAGLQIGLVGSVTATGIGSKISGVLNLTGASKTSGGTYQVDHNLGNQNYIVLATTFGDTQAKIAGIEYANNYFIVRTSDDAIENDSAFKFILFVY